MPPTESIRKIRCVCKPSGRTADRPPSPPGISQQESRTDGVALVYGIDYGRLTMRSKTRNPQEIRTTWLYWGSDKRIGRYCINQPCGVLVLLVNPQRISQNIGRLACILGTVQNLRWSLWWFSWKEVYHAEETNILVSGRQRDSLGRWIGSSEAFSKPCGVRRSGPRRGRWRSGFVVGRPRTTFAS